MKKHLLLVLSGILILSTAGISQNLKDNFDSYELGPISPQADHWILWNMAVDDCNVVGEEFASPPYSMRVAEGALEDVVFIFDDLSTGTHRIGWRMFIPEGKTGYYNHQESQVPGVGWNVEVYFNQAGGSPGTASVQEDEMELSSFSYPEGEWFLIEHIIDLDGDFMEMYVNHEFVHSMIYTPTLGGINFYSSDADNRYYIDDLFMGAVEEAVCEEGEELIICDNFEEYLFESYVGENADHWTTWSDMPGGAEDAMVGNEFANSGLHSMGISNDGVQDVILKLGDRTEGIYRLKWDMYIPDNAAAYYNVQQNEEPGEAWVLDVFFNENGNNPGVGEIEGLPDSFNYPVDQWFEVEHTFNLDVGAVTVLIDGVEVASMFITETGIGGVDFFSLNSNVTYFVDDIAFSYMGSSVGLTDNSSSPYNVFPNPTTDLINVELGTAASTIDIFIYDVTGKQMRIDQVNSSAGVHQLDLSELNSGLYFLTLITESQKYTHKILVK